MRRELDRDFLIFKSICFYGINFKYENLSEKIKCIIDVPECMGGVCHCNEEIEWNADCSIPGIGTELVKLLTIGSYYHCENPDRTYHLGYIIKEDGITLSELLDKKEQIINDMKKFCTEYGLEYSEPLIRNCNDIN